MRKSVYYLTMSLDGYIADIEGGVGWLSGAPNTDYGYEQFYSEVDTIVLGRATYDQVLGFGPHFPYPDKTVLVVTTDPDSVEIPDSVDVQPVTDIVSTVARLKIAEGSTIWIGGGSTLATSLLESGLIDEIRVFVQPILLGSGVPIVRDLSRKRTLDLQSVEKWPGGVVELRYRTVKSWRSDV